MKQTFVFLLVVVGLIVLSIGGFYFRKGFINPERERMRRNVWEETHSFNAGKRQELMRYMTQHAIADGEGKGAIESAVRMIVADLPQSSIDELPGELRGFISKCMN